MPLLFTNLSSAWPALYVNLGHGIALKPILPQQIGLEFQRAVLREVEEVANISTGLLTTDEELTRESIRFAKNGSIKSG